MNSVWKQTKVKPQQLEDLVELPYVFQEHWYWFLCLNQTRPSGFGTGYITYAEMQAYFNLHDINPEPWEIDIVKMFDSISMEVQSKQQAKQQQQNKSKGKQKK